MKPTREKIADHLKKGYPISGLEAFKKFKTLSLPQHIHALRRSGMEIVSVDRVNRNTGIKFVEYVLRVKR
jgi:hypothetical protein